MLSPLSSERYEIIKQIGCGGMSVVFQARDKHTNQIVALKVLHPYLAQKEEYKNRLIREARTTFSLDHPRIPKIIALEHEGSDLFIVTEYVDGETLKDFAERHQLWRTPEVAALVVKTLAQTLEYAHSLGVVHRDIKPENIMVTASGGLKLMDFGIAHLSDEESITVTGAMVGSPAHMAPELINGLGCDARTDVFALATVFYWLATGSLPFEGNNPHTVLKNILEGSYQPIGERTDKVLPELALVIEKAMSTKPDERFHNAREFAEAISHSLAFLPNSFLNDEMLCGFLSSPEDKIDAFGPVLQASAQIAAENDLARGNMLRGAAFLNRVLADDPFNAEALQLLENKAPAPTKKKSRIIVGAASLLALASAVEITVLSFDAAPPPAPVARVQLPDLSELLPAPEIKPAPVVSLPSALPAHKPSPRPQTVPKTIVSVTPFADIWIDGKKVAQNATKLETELEPGQHNIAFRHEFAATQERTVNVTKGGVQQRIHVDLTKVKPASLIISSNVDADVAVDGAYKGTVSGSQKHPILISFPEKAFSRKLEIVVSQKGYQPYVAKHVISPGEKQNLNIKLEPEPS